ncbi:protein roadkill-like [Episyrphus balteatus]|uniref:protein roadkill-like n=1 Tax=Episyrphus balteatus TaxID=286459 RepID=UPI002485874B|nr:protein roadkill-like [Episyrphus balteatus]
MSELNPEIVENWCHTKSNIIKFNFTWTIDNFRYLQHKTGEALRSSTFSAGCDHESKWCLRLYPKGDSADSKDYIALYVEVTDKLRKSGLLARFTLSILDAHRQKTNQAGENMEYINFKNGSEARGYPKYISRGFLLNEANGLVPGNRLTIFCEVQILSDSVNTCGRKIQRKFEVPECSIGDDFCELLDSEKFSDVTLAVGEYEFQAHKNILSARSDVFAAMFEHDMKEQQSNRVVITDVDHVVLQELLHFIYTGRAPNISEMASSLLVAADKYALEQLKVLCEEALFSGLSIETAAETLVLADFYAAEQLKRNTIEFINSHAKEVIETNEWKNMVLSHPNLVAEAFEALFARKGSDQKEPCKDEHI